MKTSTRTTSRMFRPGTDYRKIYDMASHGTVPRETLLQAAARAIRKSIKKAGFDLTVLTNPGHKSNGHKSMNVARRPGWVRLGPCKAA